jgi:hypothetical protein
MSTTAELRHSLKPLVSRLDNHAANYITTETAEGHVVHYYDLDEKPEPASASATPSPFRAPTKPRINPSPPNRAVFLFRRSPRRREPRLTPPGPNPSLPSSSLRYRRREPREDVDGE